MSPPAFAFPLRTHEGLIEGPIWAVTLVSQLPWVNAWGTGGVAVVTHRLWINLWTTMWRKVPVLWITAGQPQWWV